MLKALSGNIDRAEDEKFISRGIYLKNIIKRHLNHWRFAVPLLRLEREALQHKEDLLVKRFRMVRLFICDSFDIDASREGGLLRVGQSGP